MPVLQRVKRAATRKGRKILLDREPKVVENTKSTLFIKGRKASTLVMNCMKDLYDIKKPLGKLYTKKHDYVPFEDIGPIEYALKKFDLSMFMFVSHSKKRPHNLVLGRLYDHHLLDMIELSIENYKGLKEFKTEKIAEGIKPCLLFAGDEFEHNHEYVRLKSLFVDMFKREDVPAVRLQGIEHVIMITVADEMFYFRSYRILMKKSGSRIPRVELEEIGPSIDFKIRRLKLASDDLFKLACKTPKELRAKKVKNVSTDPLGTKHGRIHIPKQNIDKLQTRKMKGLKKSNVEKKQQRKRKSESFAVSDSSPKKTRTEDAEDN